MSASFEQLTEEFRGAREEILAGLKEFLAFPSISTEAAHESDCRDCARWLQGFMKDSGLSADLIETPTKPLVLGRFEKPGAPKLLYYGHYDVQPVEPLSEWDSEPFKAEERAGRLYARGAQDNKGQLFFFLSAVRHLIAKGALDVDLTVLIEGEEECGSPSLSAVLPEISDRIQAESILICDTGTNSPEEESIVVGLRGVTALSVKLSGLRADLHSGLHGGLAPNPAQEMIALLSKLHDEQGRVRVPGFYEGLIEPAEEELRLARESNLSEAEYREQIGVEPRGGEQGLEMALRRGFRPTLEVNGIVSGYGGPGMKAVIPESASAALSMRIAGGQDPKKILSSVRSFLEEHAPQSLKLEFPLFEEGGPALKLPLDSREVNIAKSALERLGAKAVRFIWEGASIPIIPELSKHSGASPLMVGFGLEEDNMHAPNESFMLSQFEKGFVFSALFLDEFARARA